MYMMCTAFSLDNINTCTSHMRTVINPRQRRQIDRWMKEMTCAARE